MSLKRKPAASPLPKPTCLASKSPKKKAKKSAPKKFIVELTEAEIVLLTDALDSHRYWQLSDDHYRRDGFVMEPGSDDDEKAEEIKDCDALEAKLEKVQKP